MFVETPASRQTWQTLALRTNFYSDINYNTKNQIHKNTYRTVITSRYDEVISLQ